MVIDPTGMGDTVVVAIGALRVPQDVLWDFASSALSGLIIAGAVYLLARRQFRSERWYERQVESYSAIVKSLHTIYVNARRVGHAEDLAEDGLPVPYFPDELKQFRAAAREAEPELREQLDLRRFFLTPRAVEVLENYFRAKESDAYNDTTHPGAALASIAHQAYHRFYELTQVDLARKSAMWWHYRRLKDWLALSRTRLSNRTYDWPVFRRYWRRWARKHMERFEGERAKRL